MLFLRSNCSMRSSPIFFAMGTSFSTTDLMLFRRRLMLMLRLRVTRPLVASFLGRLVVILVLRVPIIHLHVVAVLLRWVVVIARTGLQNVLVGVLLEKVFLAVRLLVLELIVAGKSAGSLVLLMRPFALWSCLVR